MRTRNEIRENGFVVARQYLADAGTRDRPIGPVYQLHLDAIDMLEELAEKDAEIEQLRDFWEVCKGAHDALREQKAERDETICCLKLALEMKDKQAEIALRDNQLYIKRADAEIERLRNIARLASNLTERLAEINLTTDNARAIAAAMQYGKETAALAEALTEVGE